MDPTLDELVGAVDLFGGLSREELVGGFQDIEWPLASAFSSACGKVLKPNFPAGAPESLAILDVI